MTLDYYTQIRPGCQGVFHDSRGLFRNFCAARSIQQAVQPLRKPGSRDLLFEELQHVLFLARRPVPISPEHISAAEICSCVSVANNSTFFIFSKPQISAVFLLKCPILQSFPTLHLFDANRASSQFFPYCFILVPARLVKTLVNCCSVPMGFFRLAPTGAFLPVHHQTAHECKHSASH